jgi:hypothetical protein
MAEFEGKSMPVEDGEEKEEEDTSLANPDVTTKYQEAAKIVNSTLAEIMTLVGLHLLRLVSSPHSSQCVPGANVVDICRAGDQIILTVGAFFPNILIFDRKSTASTALRKVARLLRKELPFLCVSQSMNVFVTTLHCLQILL